MQKNRANTWISLDVVLCQAKSYFLLSCESDVVVTVNINWNIIFITKIWICDKISQKISTLAHISFFMKLDQKRQVMEMFISSQYGYALVFIFFFYRLLKSCIDLILDRLLRIIQNDKSYSFKELLDKGTFIYS